MSPHFKRDESGSKKRVTILVLSLVVASGLVALLIGGIRAIQLRRLTPPTPLGDFAFLEGRSPLESSPPTAPAGDRIYTFRTDYTRLVFRAERELTAEGWKRDDRPDWPHSAVFKKDNRILEIARRRTFVRPNPRPDEGVVYNFWSPEEPGLPNASYTSESARGWVSVQGMWLAPLR